MKIVNPYWKRDLAVFALSLAIALALFWAGASIQR